jgi:hypothetical protein
MGLSKHLVRLSFFLALFLGLPLAGKAQTCSQNPSVQFGTASTVPDSSYACYDATQSTCYGCQLVSTSNDAPTFSATWPSYFNPGGTINIPVSFDPSAGGTYSASLSATYWSQSSYHYETLTITASGTYSAPINGFINPKYVVVGVTYAPPGTSSSVTYTNTTSVGNTTSISNSFSKDVGFSISVSNGAAVPAAEILNGSVKLTFIESTDYTQTSNSSTTTSISKASTIAYTTPGTPAFSPVNSDYDYIWLWINPEILVNATPANGNNPATLQQTGWAFDPTDPVSGEPPPSGPYNSGPDIVQVQVGCLTGDFSCPSTLVITNGVVTSGTLARSWAANEYTWPAGEGPGLTTADITNILSFDPLIPSNNYTLLSSFPSTTSDGRFTKEPYPPNPIQYAVGGATEMYNTVQQDTQSVATGLSNSFKQAFGASQEFGTGFFGFFNSTTTMTESLTLTWNHSWLDTLTTTTTMTDALTVKGPPDPPPSYSGPTQFIAYQDNLFGTFAFVPVAP